MISNYLIEKIDGSLAVPYEHEEEGYYTFSVGDLDYGVIFEEEGPDVAELVFYLSDTEKGGEWIYDMKPVGLEVAQKVFHTVWMITQDFLNEQRGEIEILQFSSKKNETSRAKFYRMLAAQLAQHFGYSTNDIETIEGRPDRKDEIIFLVPVAQINTNSKGEEEI